MEIWEQLEHVHSKEDLAKFVLSILGDLNEDRSDWENLELEDYLEAIEALVRSRKGDYSPGGERVTSPLSWNEIAAILFYAARYE